MKTQYKKSFIVIYVFAASLFFSCAESIEKKEKKMFPKEEKIVFSNMNVDEYLGKLVSIKSVNNYLVITETNIDTQIQLINKETKENYMFGQQGEGPGHLLSSADIIPISDKDIGIYDLHKRTLFGFNTDSIIKLNTHCKPEVLLKLKVSSYPLAIDRLNEHTYVFLGSESGLKRLTFLNANGEVISTEGSLPAKKDENVSDFVHTFAYWGRLTTNVRESKIAVCTNYAGMIQIYDCKTDNIQLIKEHNLFFADYSERAGNFIPDAQTRWGYTSMDSNGQEFECEADIVVADIRDIM
jgi:hypothetical protein